MTVYIKVFGGKKVKSVVDRSFATPADALQYLTEWGVPSSSRGTHFEIPHANFSLSTAYEDLVKGIDKPAKNGYIPLDTKQSPTGRQPSRPVTQQIPVHTPEVKKIKAAFLADSRKEIHQGVSTPGQSPDQVKPTGKLVCLKEICRDIDMDPRTARQKLRKLNPGNSKQRWEWTSDEVPAIIAKLGGK